MLYPVAFLFEDQAGYSVAVPDLPGVFTAADTFDEALGNVNEAVTAAYLGESKDFPPPSRLEDWERDPDWSGWEWVMLDVALPDA